MAEIAHERLGHSGGAHAAELPRRLLELRVAYPAFGGVYPVLREAVCRNALYGPMKVFLADRLDEVLLAGVSGMRLLFTNEGARECVEVAKSFLGKSEYRPNGLTRGLYYRGVD